MEIVIIAFGAAAFLCWVLFINTRTPEIDITTENNHNIPEDVLEREFKELRERFATGEIANRMTSDLILKKGEHLIFDIPGVSLCEERTVKTSGTTRSVRVRVMKGVSVGVGSFEASPETKVVPIDTGNMTLTNKRVHFAGETKTVDYPLSKINTIESLDSGVAISRTGKTKVEYYLGTDNMSLRVTISPEEGEDFESEQISYILDGTECRGIFVETISMIE